MIKLPENTLSLSSDETALIFALINKPDFGQAVLAETYGHISEAKASERLLAAGHSLLARRYACIGHQGQVILDSYVESFFGPVIKPKKMLQVIIKSNLPFPDIINIYVSDHQFTAQRVSNGVVREFTRGISSEIPDSVSSWLSLPLEGSQKYQDTIKKGDFKISLNTLIELEENENLATNKLRTAGLPSELLQRLVVDALNPVKKGSIVQVILDSGGNMKTDEAGKSIIFFSGETTSWIIYFETMLENAIGTLIPISEASINDSIQRTLS